MQRSLLFLGLFSIASLGWPCRGGEIEEFLDVPYGSDDLQRLDIYRPKAASAAGPRPAVLWIHGGGWTEGDKRQEPNGISVLRKPLVERGFVALSCNYRMLPKHAHPAQIDDVQRAVRWIRAHAAQYGIDPQRVGAAGISAGAHLAAMLAVRDTRAPGNDALDSFSSRVQAAVALNGPMDLRTTAETTPILTAVARRLSGGDAQKAADASPALFVDPRAAPLLFIVGDKDTLVPYGHSTRMAEQLTRQGCQAEVLVLPGAGHAIFPSITPRARDALLDFLVKLLKP